MTGKAKEELPPTGTFIWVDVRDLALAHVKAAELPDAANKRFYVTAGHFSNEEAADIMRDNFPELKNELPAKGTKGENTQKKEFSGTIIQGSKKLSALSFEV